MKHVFLTSGRSCSPFDTSDAEGLNRQSLFAGTLHAHGKSAMHLQLRCFDERPVLYLAHCCL